MSANSFPGGKGSQFNTDVSPVYDENGKLIGYTDNPPSGTSSKTDANLQNSQANLSQLPGAIALGSQLSGGGGAVAAGTPAAPTVLSIGGQAPVAAGGSFPPALGAVGAAAYLSNIYEGGGKDLVRGKTNKQDIANLALDVNPVTAPINMIGRQFGAPSVGKALFGASTTHQEEANRQHLADQGIDVPNSGVKEWENNPTFATSRNEADLTGKDIIHAAQFYGIDGYDKLDPAKQENLANEALKENLIREEHGQIDLSMTPEYQKYVDSQINPVASTQTTQTDSRQVAANNKKDRKRAALSALLPDIMSTPTQGPRYDQNPGSLITNPYL